MPVSTISTVEKTGYELVRSRKPKKGKRVTMQQFAKMDFEPWKEERPIPPTPENLEILGTNARIAFQTLTRSKDQLIEMVHKLDIKILDDMMTCLADAHERFKGLALACDMAYTRILVAACAHEVAKKKKKHSKRRTRKAVAS